MEPQEKTYLGKKGTSGTFGSSGLAKVGLAPLVVASEEMSWAITKLPTAKEKAELIDLPGRRGEWQPVAQVALFLWLLHAVHAIDTIRNTASYNKARKRVLLGSAPAELVRMDPTSSPGALRSARQFEGFVYVDGQLGREPGRYQFHLSEAGK